MKKIDRKVVTNVRNILSIIACGWHYGHRNQIFDHFAANMIGTLTKEEIEEYINEFSDKEDYDNVKEDLFDWFNISFKDNKAI